MWNIRCQFRTCPPFYVWLNLVEFWSILWFLLLLNGRLHGMSFLALKSDVPEGPWDQPRETQGHRGSHCKLTHWKSKINESPDVYQHCQQESQNMFEAFYLNLELVSNLGVKLISATVHFVSQHNDGICGFPASIATSVTAIAIKGPKRVARVGVHRTMELGSSSGNSSACSGWSLKQSFVSNHRNHRNHRNLGFRCQKQRLKPVPK